MLYKIYNKLKTKLKKRSNKPVIKPVSLDDEIEKQPKHDAIDYDGMGDWGRFPPIKK